MRAKQHTLNQRLVTAAMSVAMILTLFPAGASARSANPVVMTRNVYLGADLIPVILAPDAPSLFQAAADVFVNVNATDFSARAKLLAQEVADASPDLIGLQEVALWRTGTLGDPAPATTVAYDFLGLLQDELSVLGEGYTAAVVQSTFDGEVPATLLHRRHTGASGHPAYTAQRDPGSLGSVVHQPPGRLLRDQHGDP